MRPPRTNRFPGAAAPERRAARRGQSLLEYVVILALIAVLGILVAAHLGRHSRVVFNTTTDAFKPPAAH